MKKFKFSLEKVLSYKAQVEESLRNEHAVTIRNVRNKEEEIEKLGNMRNAYMDDYDRQKKGVCSPQNLQAYNMYFTGIEDRISQETFRLTALREEERLCREKVLEAKKERTSLEMLKGKKIKEYEEACRKEEELLIEEFVANKSAAVKRKYAD